MMNAMQLGKKVYLITDMTASDGNTTLLEELTCSADVFYDTGNAAIEIELPEIPAPKQVFEREVVQVKPHRRAVDVRGRLKKFTQARVRR